MRLDGRADHGVPGWVDDRGRHVRLVEALAASPPERHAAMIAEHRAAAVVLALGAFKLAGELPAG